MTAIATVAPAVPALAAAPTRAEYVERVEPICAAEIGTSGSVLEGVDEMIRKGELQPAGERFAQAAAALGRAIGRLAAVPRPTADASRLARWLRHARTGEALLRRIGQGLREGKRSRAEGMADRLLLETKRANATVVGFNFDHCRLQPARFV